MIATPRARLPRARDAGGDARVIGAVGRRLDDDHAVELEGLHHLPELGEGRRLWCVAASLPVREAFGWYTCTAQSVAFGGTSKFTFVDWL